MNRGSHDTRNVVPGWQMDGLFSGGVGVPAAWRTIRAAADLDAFTGLEGPLDIAGGTAHIPVMTEAAKRIMRGHPADPHHDRRRRIGRRRAEGRAGAGGYRQYGPGRERRRTAEVRTGLLSVCDRWRGGDRAPGEQGPQSDHPAGPGHLRREDRQLERGGGADRGIHLYSRDEASGTREVFWEKLLDKGEVSTGSNVVASNGAMKVAVGGDEGAIGYLSIGYVEQSVAALAIDGVAADAREREERFVQSGPQAVHEHQGRTFEAGGGFHRLYP